MELIFKARNLPHASARRAIAEAARRKPVLFEFVPSKHAKSVPMIQLMLAPYCLPQARYFGEQRFSLPLSQGARGGAAA